MDQLIKEGASRIKFAILIGTDARLIEDALKQHAPLVEYQIVDQVLRGRELMQEVVRKWWLLGDFVSIHANYTQMI